MNIQSIVTFLSELERNNTKAWFEANKTRYEALRKEWTEGVEAFIMGIAGFDSPVQAVQAKDCLFRIYRDVRFSKDKSPYKTTFSAVISPEGKKSPMPLYYVQIDAKGELFVAGGVYMPDREPLAAIRAFIAAHPERVSAVLHDAEFRAAFGGLEMQDSLTRLPKGYEDDVPHPELIKLKNFVASKTLHWQNISTEEVLQNVVQHFHVMYPLVRLLREAIARG
jgi:uncharacterized protein (TIGR02453 family)